MKEKVMKTTIAILAAAFLMTGPAWANDSVKANRDKDVDKAPIVLTAKQMDHVIAGAGRFPNPGFINPWPALGDKLGFSPEPNSHASVLVLVPRR